jgi:ribosomal protein L22
MSPELPRRRRKRAKEQEASQESPAAERTASEAADVQSAAADTAAAADAEVAADAQSAAAEQAGAAQETAAAQSAGAEEAQPEKPAAPRRARATRGGAQGRAGAADTAAQAAPEQSEEAAAQPAPRPAPRRRLPEDGHVTIAARARYVRTSPRKARIVCVHIRGKSVADARAILQFTPRAVARDWSKLLESAVANAEHNYDPPLQADDLVVREAYADAGPTIRRFRPRAMGRATPIRKRTSHLTIKLSPQR